MKNIICEFPAELNCYLKGEKSSNTDAQKNQVKKKNLLFLFPFEIPFTSKHGKKWLKRGTIQKSLRKFEIWL